MSKMEAFNRSLLLILLLLTDPRSIVASSPNNHRYNVGDHVPLFVNKVAPLDNPSETYQYYELPFCRPDPVIQKKESLGEVLSGDRLTSALYKLNYRENKVAETLCHKKLQGDDVAKFRDAVINDFYFQMYYDDLPFWGFVGKIEDYGWTLEDKSPKYFLFKHVEFNVFYNGNHVIEVHAIGDPNRVVDITEDVGIDVEFTYSVTWNTTSAAFDTRMDRYSRASSLPFHQKIHWFSFINSFITIVLLIGLLALLFVRRLKNDLRTFSTGDDEEEDREVGWKYIHGDIFRYPRNKSLFCAVMGMGTQLLTLVCCLFVLVSLGVLYPYNRGTLCTALVILYSLTSVVAGYTTVSFHCQFAETGWGRSVLLAGIMYAGPLFVIGSILNVVAVSYGATAALPFGTIMVIILIYTFLTIPLLVLGGVIGNRFRSEFQPPCATKRYPRDIPPLAWYRKTPCQMFLGGFLPFSAIVLELQHLYASLWGYRIFTLPSILFIMFIILILLTAILSVGLTYIQLSVEDYQWWWRSVLCGGSTSIFMFAYGIYFYARSSMSGLLQFSFFVGYNACMCYAFFLMLGTVGFRSSLMFVRYIYRSVKSE
ncbi:Transmembrane 9 superfamily member 5 [Hibiscus syriacus]|uniref:Transmembrane 9 superfamily member n=1 Tax=Hibiscus syriacus TaxID=106335 RepID=A0A6A3CKQ6_HIBSY|nr:transmembrane 9 superfamily member 5-like [Hibiscus syriacus]KAE8729406.1 Transmembrane 9 superfamily member 5 [Hibiscus syriacus]